MRASVLINNYNYGKYLKYCLESVLQQTYSDVEIIVYDDGSTDQSLSIMESYGERITILANSNYGKSPNQNQANGIYQAFLKSSGDIIFLLDSDDAFHHEKIDEIMTIFKQEREIDAIQHPFNEIDENNNVKNIVRPVLKEIESYKEYIFSTENLFHLFSSTSGLVFRRDILNQILPLQEDNLNYIWPDVRIMLYIALKGKIKTIKKPLGFYRIHGKNHSGQWSSIENYQQCIEELYEYFNQLALKSGYEKINLTQERYLENTYFYNLIDRERLSDFLHNHSGETWIWGAGEAGQTILYSLANTNYEIEGFIDSNPKKHGATVMNKEIIAPEKMIASSEMKIIVSPFHAYSEISRHLNALGLVENLNYIYPYYEANDIT